MQSIYKTDDTYLTIFSHKSYKIEKLARSFVQGTAQRQIHRHIV